MGDIPDSQDTVCGLYFLCYTIVIYLEKWDWVQKTLHFLCCPLSDTLRYPHTVQTQIRQ